MFLFFFFFNDTATTEIYTLPLHDALPISTASARRSPRRSRRSGRAPRRRERGSPPWAGIRRRGRRGHAAEKGRDRKSTRLNSSHANTSYAVFCLKKQKSIHRSLETYSYIT